MYHRALMKMTVVRTLAVGDAARLLARRLAGCVAEDVERAANVGREADNMSLLRLTHTIITYLGKT